MGFVKHFTKNLLGNAIYIDTGACFNGKLTVYNINTLEEA